MEISVKKSIVALAASTLLIGMSLSAIPAFADDAPPADHSASTTTKHSHMKAHHHHGKKSSKKEESSSAPK